MPDLTDADLAELQRLCDAATPGPLTACEEHRDGVVTDPHGVRVADCTWDVGDEQAHRNACFFAAARDALPALVQEVRRLRARNAELADRLFELERPETR